MTDTNPAATLRAAADKLRKLAADVEADMASNPYWESALEWPHRHPNLYCHGIDNALGGPAGKLAAAMHPGVALALADWLETAAEDGGFGHNHYPNCTPQTCLGTASLAVARAVLSEEADR